jgi:pyruvate-formate lyase-activating enzyme
MLNVPACQTPGSFENFDLISGSRSDIYVRIPVIPGYNDSQEHLERLRNFIAAHSI